MISDLPHDLESEILSRVPAKSLVRWKTACKRWYTLFKDPRFIKKNFGKSSSAKELILLTNLKVHSIRVNLHGIHNSVDPSMEFTGKLRSLKDWKDIKISTITHCDGLILCSTDEGNNKLVVWNPCTGETRLIKPRTCYKSFDKYVLGYGNNNSSCRIYKILRYCRYYNIDLKIEVAECEIYDFSSDSWMILDDVTHNWTRIYSLGVTLKGNGYWIALDNETGFFLMNFDFTTERFGCLPLPYHQSHDGIAHPTVLSSVVREEKLVLLHHDFATVELKTTIWVTNKIDDENKEVSWSKFFVVDLDKKFMLSMVNRMMSFLVDEEKKVAICCSRSMLSKSKTRIHIVGEDIHKEIYQKTTKGSKFNWPLLVSYVPSLVQIQKKHPKAKEKEERTGGHLCKKRSK